MDVVLLAVIGLVLLLGLVAIAVGNKGWSWGTVTAAILLLLAATGYLYLAARLAERERSWREKIAKTQKEIDRIDPADGGANARSLESLRRQRDRWARASAFVDTWRGRAWGKARLSPPRDGKPGTISIEKASEESDQAPLAAGGEVAVFDNANIADEGRFLGLFRVQAVKAAAGNENCEVTIVPASNPAPPSESDVKLWNRTYDDVTVYESLPVDRWLAFHKTPTEPGAGDAEGKTDGGAAAGHWRPQPRKTSGDDTLTSLEEQMAALARHDAPVPEEEWSQLGEKLAAGEVLPGRYWAVVEFTKNVRFTKADKFALDDEAAKSEPGSEDDEEGGAAGELGAMITEGDDTGGGAQPSGPEPTAGAVTNRFKVKRFKEGEKAEFDLQTALDLQNDKQFVRITDVVERRALADPFTAIRGSGFSAKAADGQPLRAEGIDAIREALLVEMTSIDQSTARIATSRENVEAQTVAAAELKKQLESDLASWARDVAAAEATARAFDDRFRAATIELAAVESSIVRLGQELTGAWATLTSSIDAASPR